MYKNITIDVLIVAKCIVNTLVAHIKLLSSGGINSSKVYCKYRWK